MAANGSNAAEWWWQSLRAGAGVRVAVIALGEIGREEATLAVQRQLGAAGRATAGAWAPGRAQVAAAGLEGAALDAEPAREPAEAGRSAAARGAQMTAGPVERPVGAAAGQGRAAGGGEHVSAGAAGPAQDAAEGGESAAARGAQMTAGRVESAAARPGRASEAAHGGGIARAAAEGGESAAARGEQTTAGHAAEGVQGGGIAAAAADGERVEGGGIGAAEVGLGRAAADRERLDLLWVDRGDLRRRPIRAALALRARRVDAAVLVARDLGEGRLRLTSLLLALPRARERWRIDLRGGRERWTLSAHLQTNLGPVARHLAACALAATLGAPLLRALAATLKRENRPAATRPRAQTGRPDAVTGLRSRDADAVTGLRSGDADAVSGVRSGDADAVSGVRGHASSAQKVLYLRSQLWLGLAGGGSVAHTAGVISGLQECGAEVQVVSSDALVGVRAPTRIVRPEVWFDGWLRELEDLAYNVAFFVTSLKTARPFRPTLIYQRHTAFNVAGAVLSRLLRVPLVLEFNSSEVWKGRYWGGLRLIETARSVERINLQAADRIVVVSNVLAEELKQQGVPRAKILVSPNGVDPRVFSPEVSGDSVRRALGISGDEVVIGFSGTFGLWHGVPTLAEAIPRVLEARPNAQWLLIGDGPLRRLIVSSPRVHSVGMVAHAGVPAHLAACDILVSPHGRQADGGEFFGSPTKLYEYMAMGRAIVASNLGQIGDVLSDGHSALLVPPDDAAALADAIVRLIDDAGLRSRIGRAARADAQARHTWRQNAERVLGALGEPC